MSKHKVSHLIFSLQQNIANFKDIRSYVAADSEQSLQWVPHTWEAVLFPSGRGHLDFLFVALVQLSIKAPWPPSGASFIHFRPSGHLSFGSWVKGEKSRSHSLFEMLLVQHVDKTATRCCHPTPLSCLPEPALFSPLKNYITTTNPSNKLRLCFYGLQPKKTNSYQCPKLVRW